MSRRTRAARLPLITTFCLAVSVLGLPWAAQAKNCTQGTPASGVTADFWGNLKPTDTGRLPDERDSSNYDGSQRPDDVVYKTPLFTSLDVENGWIFQTYAQGIKVWNANGGGATSPALVTTKDCQASGFLRCLPGQHELRELFWDIDAPEGNDAVFAVASAPLGLMVFDASNKTSLRQVYQDYNRGILQVWSATIGGRHYAFAVDEGFAPGLHVYDMTTALSLNGCIDEPDSRGCGPYKLRIGTARGLSYIDGFRRADGRFFVVVSPGGPGVEIWDVTNPLAPIQVGGGSLLTSQFNYGVALWEQGGKQFLASQYILPGGQGQGGRIYDVTNCLNGNCADLTPLWSKPWSVGASRHFATYSKSGSKHFLYWGNEDKCSGGLQREWLFDVSNLASGGQPGDLTPPITKAVTVGSETATVDYWSWYYASNPTGFSEVMPRMGKVSGSYFYRAAWTIFDVHEITGGIAPTANFTWSPAEVYPGTVVTFTDTSSGGPTSRTWTFPDLSTSTAASPTFTFSGPPGLQPVKLEVANGSGPSDKTINIPVLDPMPVIAGGTASPLTAYVCSPITFTATGLTGKPPVGVAWSVKTGSNPPVAALSGNPATWDTTGIAPGTYKAIPTASNASGSFTLPEASAPTVILNALVPLPAAHTFTPTNDAFAAGTVQFHVNAPGATSWKWDFGDGSPVVESTDPVTGPNPVHTYSAKGSYDVKVTVDNCVETPRESNALPITITEISPLLISTWSAPCNFLFCELPVNTPIAFAIGVSGDPDTYNFDWNGDGTYDQAATTPPGVSIEHTYTQTTSSPICPKLQVLRGAENKDAVVPICFMIVGGVQQPAQITVNGPATGDANQALSFSATASNCTPAAIWNWSASGGGTVNGNGSAVTVSWATDGAKTVSVTNSGCTGASGSKNVQIGGGNNNQGLTANFNFSPASPQALQAVAFDGSSSTGAPSTYTWTFGDGQTQSLNTPTVSHTFAAPGSYTVKLEVAKPGANCPFNLCTASTSKLVVVGGGPPPLVASFDTSAECVNEFGVASCRAETSQAVSFTSTTAGATTHTWSFGDGSTATGAQVSHTWTSPGNKLVQLTVGNGQTTASVGRTFIVTGPPVAQRKSVVLPWIAQTRGALVQSSDLYLYNPGSADLEVLVTFLKRGNQPETNPPTKALTLKPHQTLFYGDVIKELFNKENTAGFITVDVEGDGPMPVITSFNNTLQTDGSKFGQAVSGATVASATEASTIGNRLQHVVGLNANSEKLAYIGVTNPNEAYAVYRLAFYDKLGRKVFQTEDIAMPGFGQQQYQAKQLATTWGINNLDDYRVEVQTVTGGQVFPYGANVRIQSADPSFVAGGRANDAVVHLVGVFGTAGLNNSRWQTDVLLANSSDQVVLTDLSFRGVGANAKSTDTIHVTLQPRETKRIENVLQTQWGLSSAVGVLTFSSHSLNGVYPTIVGEVYDNANPGRRFGQAMTARALDKAAAAGQSQHLIGLRQDAEYRSTLSLFNPGTELAIYDLVYRELDGDAIQTIANQILGPGGSRQVNPSQHPLPAAGAANGFIIEVKVKTGKVLAGGQVVNNRTNDPAYIDGETR